MAQQQGDPKAPSKRAPAAHLGKAWRFVVVVCAFLGLSSGYSSTYLYTSGLFLLPVAAHFEVTRAQASLGLLVSTLTAAVVTPFVGRLLDRFTALHVAILSLGGLAAGYVLLAVFSLDFTSYIGLSAVLAALGCGSAGMPFSRIVLDVFERRRGMALGFVMTGSGFGALVLPSLVMPIIQGQGWRSAYQWLAVLPLGSALLLTAALLPIRARLAFRHRPARSASRRTSGQDYPPLWRDRVFQMIGIMFLVLAAASVGLVVHFVPILVEAGSSPAAAAGIAGLIGLASIGGRIVAGNLLDRFPVNRLAAVVVSVAVFATALMLADAGSWGRPAALALGLVMGAETDLVAFYAVRYFPEDRYGSVFGGLFGAYLVGGAIGPFLFAYCYDTTGAYLIPLLAMMTTFALALVAIGTLPTQPRRLEPGGYPEAASV